MSIESFQMATASNTNFCNINLCTNFNTLICYYFRELPDLASSELVVFAFVIGTLLTFLQIMYLKKPESPFETHPKTILLAIGSLLLYCLSYNIKLRVRVSENYPTANYFVRISMAFFRALTVACLLSILFPEWLCTLLFTLAILYTLSYLPGFLIQMICNWWQAATHLLHRQQQQRTSSVQLRHWMAEEEDTTDQSNLPPV